MSTSRGVSAALTTGTTALGAWLLYSAVAIDHHVPLPPALDVERRQLASSRAGRLSYYVDRRGQGAPVVLLHSINAGASAYEVRPLFELLQGRRPVFALDLPGFGFSDRSDRDYAIRLYVTAIQDFLDSEVGAPADVVAMSLTSEFAARAALERPQYFRSLALLSPSGFGDRGGNNTVQRSGSSGASERVLRILRWPVWSQGLYDALVSRPSLRYFLRQSFVGEPPTDLVEYAYQTTHQPGARFAPFSFVSGRLFSPDIRLSVYERLELPALVIYDEDPFVQFDHLDDTVTRRPNWQAVRIAPTRGLPHWDQPQATLAALERFWNTAPRCLQLACETFRLVSTYT